MFYPLPPFIPATAIDSLKPASGIASPLLPVNTEKSPLSDNPFGETTSEERKQERKAKQEDSLFDIKVVDPAPIAFDKSQ